MTEQNQQAQAPCVVLKAEQKESAQATLPECCGTGCTVCVLDYPELFLPSTTGHDLAMLAAIEQALTGIENQEELSG